MKKIFKGRLLKPQNYFESAKLKKNYIPLRYILVAMFIVAGTLLVVAAIAFLCLVFKFYVIIPVFIVYVLCVLKIIRSEDNPDYKIPWLILIFALPLIGIILYLLFYSRRLPKRQQMLFASARSAQSFKDDCAERASLAEISLQALGQVNLLCAQSGAHLYKNTSLKYFPSGEDMYVSLLKDLKSAQKYIFLEFFIIEQGFFWDRILGVIKDRIANGVEVSVIYDDLGCMRTLPGNYFKRLRKLGINCVPFSIFRASADAEFNNRNHRKIAVIDGIIGYTGGVNIADEYINVKRRFGHWKDAGLRLEGEAVRELMCLFIVDYAMNVRFKNDKTALPDRYQLPPVEELDEGFIVPFGDGPSPVYKETVAKNILMSVINGATKYVYATTPYLIIDNELCNAFENAAQRGVDVRIITPGVPDKKIVNFMTKSYYKRLIKRGVKIYEYSPGFIHSKVLISDDTTGIVGTVNLDYRSLVHHFEDAVWFYRSPVLEDVKSDVESTLSLCRRIEYESLKDSFLRGVAEAVIRLFAPML